MITVWICIACFGWTLAVVGWNKVRTLSKELKIYRGADNKLIKIFKGYIN